MKQRRGRILLKEGRGGTQSPGGGVGEEIGGGQGGAKFVSDQEVSDLCQDD